MSWTYSTRALAEIVGGRHAGPEGRFSAVGADTRKLEPGAVFFALRGERFDANEFVGQAFEAGAAAAVVHAGAEVAGQPCVVVANTLEALQRLAAHHRMQMKIPVFALTGSCGKTSAKEFTAALLSTRHNVLKTEGNLNNEIGCPLTLMRLQPEHTMAVIEMGANHAGEIVRMCQWARPTESAVTMVGPAHLEGFGSIEGVERAKGEIAEALPEGGVFYENADDPHCRRIATRFSGRKVRFGAGRREREGESDLLGLSPASPPPLCSPLEGGMGEGARDRAGELDSQGAFHASPPPLFSPLEGGMGEGARDRAGELDSQGACHSSPPPLCSPLEGGMGEGGPVDVSLRSLRMLDSGEMELDVAPVGRLVLPLPIPAQAGNVLLAIAVALEHGVEEFEEPLRAACVRSIRWRWVEVGALRELDDSYNANPSSMRAALQALGQTPCRGKRIAALGSMLEMGPEAEALHEEVGREAAKQHFDCVFARGPHAHAIIAGAQAAGAQHAAAIDAHEAMAEAILACAEPQSLVLLKGSRGMRMEEVLAALERGKQAQEGGAPHD